MPLPVINDIMRVALHWNNSDGGFGVNILHFWDAALTGSEADLRAALNANWQNDQQLTMSNLLDQDTMVITKLDGSSAGLPFDGVGNSVGQDTGQPIPSQATVVTLRTVQGGPRGRGRIYLPGVGEGAVENGQLDGAAVTTQTEAWNDFQEAMTTDGFPLVVASYVHEDFHQVTVALVQPWVGTQKRRLNRLKT